MLLKSDLAVEQTLLSLINKHNYINATVHRHALTYIKTQQTHFRFLEPIWTCSHTKLLYLMERGKPLIVRELHDGCYCYKSVFFVANNLSKLARAFAV